MMGASAAWQAIIVEFDWGSVQADTSTGYVCQLPRQRQAIRLRLSALSSFLQGHYSCCSKKMGHYSCCATLWSRAWFQPNWPDRELKWLAELFVLSSICELNLGLISMPLIKVIIYSLLEYLQQFPNKHFPIPFSWIIGRDTFTVSQ